MDKAIRIASDSVLYKNHMACAVCTTRTCLWLRGGLFGLTEDNRTFSPADNKTRWQGALSGATKMHLTRFCAMHWKRIHVLTSGMKILRYLKDRFGAENIPASH